MKTITSLQNPVVKHLAKLRISKSYRVQEQRLLVSGITLVNEAARVFPLLTLLVSAEELFLPAENRYFVTPEVIKKISGLQHPEGIVAEISTPAIPLPRMIDRLLIIDMVSDPGNLGTLLRTAWAFGWDAVFILGTSVDPWNDKALRASRGAAFHLPIITGSWDDLAGILSYHSLPLFLADTDGALPRKQEKAALILSNESRGPSPSLPKEITRISLPMRPKVDSLNVATAGSILMYVLGGSHVA